MVFSMPSTAGDGTACRVGSVAQTNLQLWSQLQAAGYDRGDLEYVGRTYKLAIELFSGCFRASGKTFIAHLVGTASILAHLGASRTIVATGLIHAAYEFGDFGGWYSSGPTRRKRRYLQRILGQQTEQFVAGYSSLKWSTRTIPSILDAMSQWDPEKRNVLLVRLANELEEYLDLGLLYCGQKGQIYSAHQSEAIVTMAERLGQPALAAALAAAQEQMAAARVLPEMVNPTEVPRSALMVPRSCQRTSIDWISNSRPGRALSRVFKRSVSSPRQAPAPKEVESGEHQLGEAG